MKRPFSAVCGILLILSLSLPAVAATPAYIPSPAYQKAGFCQNLANLPLCGDGALDTVAVAMTQLGYHEGGSTAAFDGASTTSTGNYTEYNFALGRIGGSYSYPWCAAFVSWCLRQADAADAALGQFASCTLWVQALQKNGLFKARSTGYLPSTGDLIFFRSAGVERASDHVGLVRFVENGRVYTIEGNASNAVTLRDYAVGDAYIVGYGTPRYNGRLAFSPATMQGKVCGVYTVTAETLNLRKEPASASARVALLQRGTPLAIREIKNGWGRVEGQGLSGWVKLAYTALCAPLCYTVRYRVEDKVTEAACVSIKTAFTPQTVPEKAGERFVCWQDEQGVQYAAGAGLPHKTLLLTAVFAPLESQQTRDEESAPPSGQDAPTQPSEQDTHEQSEEPASPPFEEAGSAAASTEPTSVGGATGAAALVFGGLTSLWGSAWLLRKLFYFA